MLDKRARIRNSREYRHVFENGKRVSGRCLIVYYRRNAGDNHRFGFITNKRIGIAVIRNRIKRQLRAIVRKYQGQLINQYDIVLVARAGTGKSSFAELERDYIAIVKKAGLFAGNTDNNN